MDTKKLRQKILDLAIHGKLVPQDPNDEPASVLLERIRKEKERLIKEGKIKAPKKSKSAGDTSHYPKEGPWDLPKGWEWSMLGDISDYGKCVTVPVSAIKDDAWVLELEDIEKETGRVLKHVTKSVRSINGSRHSFSKKQILFSKLRTYLNKVLIAPDKGFCTTEIIPITPQEGIMPEYLSLVLRSPYFLDYTAQCGYGVKMPRLGTSDAVKAFIPIPPFKEQQRITEVVDRYIDILDRIQSEKEEISIYVSSCKSVILDLAIHGKLVPQDHSDEPAIDLLKRINPNFTPSDNLHYEGDVPKGWQVCTLNDIFEITMGQSPDGNSLNKTNGVEFHQGKVFFTDKILAESKVFTSSPTKYASPNSMLCCVRAPVGVFNITPRKICIGRGLCALRPRSKEINLDYWFYALSCYKDYYESQATGTTFKAISGDVIRNTGVLLPPQHKQKAILNKIAELFAIIDQISDSID